MKYIIYFRCGNGTELYLCDILLHRYSRRRNAIGFYSRKHRTYDRRKALQFDSLAAAYKHANRLTGQWYVRRYK